MKCPECKAKPMHVTPVQRRNCLRLDYFCPHCGHREADFEQIKVTRQAGRSCGSIAKQGCKEVQTFTREKPHPMWETMRAARRRRYQKIRANRTE
jgi:rubredoxin